jgi:hypothetical protein
MTINFANDFSPRGILLVFHFEKWRDFKEIPEETSIS